MTYSQKIHICNK